MKHLSRQVHSNASDMLHSENVLDPFSRQESCALWLRRLSIFHGTGVPYLARMTPKRFAPYFKENAWLPIDIAKGNQYGSVN